MIFLGVEKLRRWFARYSTQNFGGNSAKSARCQRRLKLRLRQFNRRPLPRRVAENCRAILAAGVVALTIALRWIVRFPEHFQQLLVAHFVRVVDDEDDLGVPGLPGAGLVIGRVRRVATRIADGRGIHAPAWVLPKFTLRPPKAAHRKLRELHAFREGCHDVVAVGKVRTGHHHRLRATGQRVSWADH